MTINAKTAVALGSFDGLHKGHMAVINRALSCRERGLRPVVLLFDVHPLTVLNGTIPKQLVQKKERELQLKQIGIDYEYISFLEIKDFSPQKFFDEILVKKMHAGAVCCGWNYHFGKEGAGDCSILKEMCEKSEIQFFECEAVCYDGEVISSTLIRKCIEEGNLFDANKMLGRNFSYTGVVMHGAGRGKIIGAPTINQYFDDSFVVPKTGSYVSVLNVSGKSYPSVTNIGLRPTFENEDIRSETWIIGFDGDLYDEEVRVELVKYIREEKRFSSLDELKAQIAEDAVLATEIYKQIVRE